MYDMATTRPSALIPDRRPCTRDPEERIGQRYSRPDLIHGGKNRRRASKKPDYAVRNCLTEKREWGLTGPAARCYRSRVTLLLALKLTCHFDHGSSKTETRKE